MALSIIKNRKDLLPIRVMVHWFSLGVRYAQYSTCVITSVKIIVFKWISLHNFCKLTVSSQHVPDKHCNQYNHDNKDQWKSWEKEVKQRLLFLFVVFLFF